MSGFFGDYFGAVPGGSGGGNLPPELLAGLELAVARINAVPGTGPIISVPAPQTPAGKIPVLFCPTFLELPATATAALRYVNKEEPYSPGSAELTRRLQAFALDETDFTVYAGIFVPKPKAGDTALTGALYETLCADANLVEDSLASRWRARELPENRTYWFEHELRKMYAQELEALSEG